MVELALTPDRRWGASPVELAPLAAAAGFVGLGLAADEVGPDTVAALEAHGLRCHELLVLWADGSPDELVEAGRRLVGPAEQAGAEWVLTVVQGDRSPERLDALGRCTAMLAEVGCGVAVEFVPDSPVSTIAEGLDVVHALQRHGRAGVLVDTWHFTVGASTWDDLARLPLDDIAYVQFDDVLAPESDHLMHETLHRRGLPGQGTADLARFATRLVDRGWDGTVSVEVLNAELRDRPLPDIVTTLHDTTAPYWR